MTPVGLGRDADGSIASPPRLVIIGPPAVTASPAYPSGEVTFLFTDIEGSTRLWERDAAVMWRALEQHNALLRTAITTHGGVSFKTIGDAFQAAFPSAPAAVAAAASAQRSLAAAAWDETGPIRVRMALHVGLANPVDGDYTAPCLNRLSRLLSTGYGGQVLLTDVVRRLVAADLPREVTLRDLGRHRLRDLLEPEQVAQLVVAGLPDHFPPLKSLERHPTNLPIQPTELIGRDDDLTALKALLGPEGAPDTTGVRSRLVTLTGAGGTGKTRLALQVAADLVDAFDDGAFFVDLAPLADPSLVLPAIAQTLGVRESGGLTLGDALIGYLEPKHLLLVLDNCEQVLAAASQAGELLARCPGLAVLATSRAPLRLRAEHEFAVAPLSVPDPRRLPPVAELAAIPAIDLFVRRAAAARRDFALTADNARAVAEICVRLDGLPLAIELAAARVKMLAPAALLQRLGSRLGLLTGGARDLPARQRTLRDTIAWSYDLLTSDDQTLFRRLGCLVGGFGFEAAEAIANGTGRFDVFAALEVLIDQSLVRQTDPDPGESSEPRFAMLETLREFAVECLESSGEGTAVRSSHAAYFVGLAEEASSHLEGHDQAVWLDRLEQEHDNLRAVIAWLGTTGDVDARARICGNLARFWHMRGHLTEGRRWLDEVLTTQRIADRATELSALLGAGRMAELQGDFAAAGQRYAAALVIARELDDRAIAGMLLNNLAGVALEQGDLDRAAALYAESLEIAEALGDRVRQATVLGNLGAVAHYRGDLEQARTHYEACLALSRDLGDQFGQATMLFNLLVLIAPLPEEYARARSLGEEALALSRRLGDKEGVALALGGLGLAAEAAGACESAIDFHRQALDLFAEIGDASGIARAQGNLGCACLAGDQLDDAVAACHASLSGFAAIGDQDGSAYALDSLAMIACRDGRCEGAARWLGTTDALRADLGLALPLESRRRHEQTIAELRDRLGAEAFKAAWNAGQAAPIADAIAEALAAYESDRS